MQRKERNVVSSGGWEVFYGRLQTRRGWAH